MFADVKTIQDLNFEGFPQADFHHGMSWPLFIESKKRGICFAKVDGIDMGLIWDCLAELGGPQWNLVELLFLLLELCCIVPGGKGAAKHSMSLSPTLDG